MFANVTNFVAAQLQGLLPVPVPTTQKKKENLEIGKNGKRPRSRGVGQPAAQVPPRKSAANTSVPRYCCHPDCALTATFASCKALLAAHPPWGAASSAPQAGETSAEARPRAWHPTARVHPSAIVDPRAVLDRDACVGPLCVLGPGAVFFVVSCICACVGQFLCASMHVRIHKHMH